MPPVVYHTESGGRLRGRRRGFSAAAGGRGFSDPSRAKPGEGRRECPLPERPQAAHAYGRKLWKILSAANPRVP